ncbi:MAG: nuclease A inhibitor family protein [Actinomycetota bacterium]
MTDTITAKLSSAAEGLLWMSESESLLVPFCWKSDGQPLTPAKLLQLAGHPASSPVQAIAVDEFFAPAIEEQDWYGDEEKATALRYRKLVEFLKSNLTDIKVYRVGQSPEIHIYVAGITRDNNLAGISTTSIET